MTKWDKIINTYSGYIFSGGVILTKSYSMRHTGDIIDNYRHSIDISVWTFYKIIAVIEKNNRLFIPNGIITSSIQF